MFLNRSVTYFDNTCEQDNLSDRDISIINATGTVDPIRSNQGDYVLYWMQQSQRIEYNHALVYAILQANKQNLPLVVFFGLSESYPDANERHYTFMLEGLSEVEKTLKSLGITFVCLLGTPENSIEGLLGNTRYLVMDKGYLRHQREWRTIVAKTAQEHGVLSCVEIEADTIVPVSVASPKEEYMARTLRPKIEKLLPHYVYSIELPEIENRQRVTLDSDSQNKVIDFSDIETVINRLPIDHTVKRSDIYHGGHREAMRHLTTFVEEKLINYGESNSPAVDLTSKLSMYLHFGHISALEIYHVLSKEPSLSPDAQSAKNQFIEQLIVRRELAINYVTYREGYDTFDTMTNAWAYQTMGIHQYDDRDYLYTQEQMILGQTHDDYFNTCMLEMVHTGFMHSYMRMYWCKKIIEWTPSHRDAYKIAVTLNNRYFIDGRDANSYTGIAWCFGLHDQGFRERAIFGKLRYMNDLGLRRKFDMNQYIQRIKQSVNGRSSL